VYTVFKKLQQGTQVKPSQQHHSIIVAHCRTIAVTLQQHYRSSQNHRTHIAAISQHITLITTSLRFPSLPLQSNPTSQPATTRHPAGFLFSRSLVKFHNTS